MSEDDIKLLTAGVALLSTLLGVVAGALTTYFTNRGARRRNIYGDAVRTVVAWSEMPHRVRRRGEGEDAALREQFHRLQEEFACHRGLIGSESSRMERSYLRLTRAVKAKTADPLRLAWDDDLDPSDVSWAELDPEISEFLTDVRAHVSPWPWRKVTLWWRARAYAA